MLYSVKDLFNTLFLSMLSQVRITYTGCSDIKNVEGHSDFHFLANLLKQIVLLEFPQLPPNAKNES